MSKALEDDADPTYTHFRHRDEFLALLHRFLDVPLRYDPATPHDTEVKLVESLGAILDYYLPLPGLLDPHLDEIIPPLMTKLGGALERIIDEDEHSSTSSFCPERLARLGRVIDWVVKVRGWKAVVPHFPSSLNHLSDLVHILSPTFPATSSSTSHSPSFPHHPLVSPSASWELRATLLLWLSLLLTVPFSLATLSSSTSAPLTTLDIPAQNLLFSASPSPLARQVVLLTVPLLSRPGKEGSFAALTIARLFSRSDAVHGLAGFFDWAGAELQEGEREGEAHFVASILGMLAVLPTLLPPNHLALLADFQDQVMLRHLRGSRTTASSGLIRKLAVKAKGRWWVSRLGKGVLDDEDTPEGLEEVLDDLMTGLSDKDTIVRYSSAKYLARLAALLPLAFSSDIASAIIGLFSGTEDDPVVETAFGVIIDPGGTASSESGMMGFGGAEVTRGEARWHGVCLALAEMARRGLLKGANVGDAVTWVLKALSFDLRRASHSVGANVRDAAAYLLWSMSRACSPTELQKYADDMATALVCISCFDREVGVRRAASAAYQEGVGRLGLYPEGIDVLGKTDFYSVSVRRIAFQDAAPAVAIHKTYRRRMFLHLHHITLRHWDVAMRSLGASALHSILDIDIAHLDASINLELSHVPSLDPINVHGALLGLISVSPFLPPDAIAKRSRIMLSLDAVRPAALVSSNAAEILTAACRLLSAYLCEGVLDSEAGRQVEAILHRYVDMGAKRRETEVQQAVGQVYSVLSGLRDCSKEVAKLIADLKSTRAPQRQTAALSLGKVQYALCESKMGKATTALIGQLEQAAKADVETRRYAIYSLSSVACQLGTDGKLLVNADTFQVVLASIIKGLDDYSTDQRGDIGSWIRIASCRSLGKLVAFAASHGSKTLLPQALFDNVVAGIVKQGVEKLEQVREAAGRSLGDMRVAKAGSIWQWEGEGALCWDSDDAGGSDFRHADPKAWYALAMPLLDTKYRASVIAGLVLTIGSQVESVAAVAAAALLDRLTSSADMFELFLADVLDLLTKNINTNRVLLPGLSAMTRICKSDMLSWTDGAAITMTRIIGIACRAIPQIKSIERISASMKLCVAALTLPNNQLRAKTTEQLPLFLAHRFPRIRALTAEQVYLALSSAAEDDLDPDLEEILLETNWVEDGVGPDEAAKIVDLVSTATRPSSIPM